MVRQRFVFSWSYLVVEAGMKSSQQSETGITTGK